MVVCVCVSVCACVCVRVCVCACVCICVHSTIIESYLSCAPIPTYMYLLTTFTFYVFLGFFAASHHLYLSTSTFFQLEAISFTLNFTHCYNRVICHLQLECLMLCCASKLMLFVTLKCTLICYHINCAIEIFKLPNPLTLVPLYSRASCSHKESCRLSLHYK